jgi:CubicO group peptidase (beta-lactamase class C family)
MSTAVLPRCVAALAAVTLLASEGSAQAADSLLREVVWQGQVAGAVALVWSKGHTVYSTAVGVRSLASGQPMRLTDRFRIASMTKPVVSAAAMMLVERGLVSLDDPVSRFIPEFASVQVYDGPGRVRPPKRPMLVRHLLTHTSGLSGGFDRSAVDSLYARKGAVDTASLEAHARSLARLPLAADPGDRWIYSLSTNVLGRIIEVASGTPLDTFLQRELLEPLEMRSTGFQIPRDAVDELVEVHRWDGRALAVLPGPRRDLTQRPTLLRGVGGLVSTAEDYLKFARMLRDGGVTPDGRRLLRPETVEAMRSHRLSLPIGDWGVAGRKQPGEGIGYGFAVIDDPAATGHPAGKGTYYWSGSLATFFWIDPTNDVIAILMTQHEPMSAHDLDKRFIDAVYRDLGRQRTAAQGEPVEILLLGTFHFHNPGLDVAKFKVPDIRSPERQAEVLRVVEALARFRPTHIAVEQVHATHGDSLRAQYRRFREGSFALTANEIHQLSFRLAAQFAHDSVFAVDFAKGMDIPGLMSYASANDTAWVRRFRGIISDAEQRMNRMLSTQTVGETLREMNGPELLRMAEAAYVDMATVGAADSGKGAAVLAQWYERNLRIFGNLARIGRPGDRILFVVGQGHVPILRHLIENHPNMRLVDPLPYLPRR